MAHLPCILPFPRRHLPGSGKNPTDCWSQKLVAKNGIERIVPERISVSWGVIKELQLWVIRNPNRGNLVPAASDRLFPACQVEFPEARIYEETLNILLYESQDGRGPDNALLEATGGAAGRSHHLEEDDERERIERVRRIHIKRPDDRAHLHQ